MSPCSCGSFPGRDNVVRMRAHTLDDSRAYQAHSIDLVNIDSSVFQTYQKHPARAQIAVAHFLGHIEGIKDGMRDVDTGSDGERMSAEKWAAKEAQYRDMGLDDDEIAMLKKTKGPADSGVAAITGSPPPCSRRWEETGRSTSGLPYTTLRRYRGSPFPTSFREHVSEATQSRQRPSPRVYGARHGYGDQTSSPSPGSSRSQKSSFGYTREQHVPGDAAIRGFRHPRQHEGKYPVFAVSSSTEALLVTLSAKGRARVPPPPGRDRNGTGQRGYARAANYLRSSQRRKISGHLLRRSAC